MFKERVIKLGSLRCRFYTRCHFYLGWGRGARGLKGLKGKKRVSDYENKNAQYVFVGTCNVTQATENVSHIRSIFFHEDIFS